LQINEEEAALPLAFDGTRVYRSDESIVVDAPGFNVQFDGDKLLKAKFCFEGGVQVL